MSRYLSIVAEKGKCLEYLTNVLNRLQLSHGYICFNFDVYCNILNMRFLSLLTIIEQDFSGEEWEASNVSFVRARTCVSISRVDRGKFEYPPIIAPRNASCAAD